MAEFVTKAENQRRLIVLIMCIIADTAALGGIIFSWKGASDIEQGDPNKYQDTLKIRRADLEAVRKERREIETAYVRFSQLVGWRMLAEGTTDRFVSGGLSGGQLTSFLNKWATILTTEHKVPADQVKPPDQTGTGTDLVLVKLFDKLKELEEQYRAECTKLEGQIAAERTREVNAITGAADAEKRAMDQIKSPDGNSGLVMDYQRLLKDYYNLQKQHDAELFGDGSPESRGLEGKAYEAQKGLTELRKKNSRAKTELDAKKVEYRTRRDLIIHNKKEAEERKEPDGSILAIDTPSNVAYIDLLHVDRIFRGTRFKVYSLEKGGVKVDKGEVEVTVVRERTSSVVAVTKVYNASEPIKAGDKIYNEYYEKGKTRYIVIAGRLTGKLSNEEAAAVVKEFGDVFQEKVDQRTSYVVLGDGYETSDAFKMAQEWGVKYLRERSLYDYLGVPHD